MDPRPFPVLAHSGDSFTAGGPPDRADDAWTRLAGFEHEADAVAIAEAKAAVPHPGAGDLAERVVVLRPGHGHVVSKQRPGD
jgi:hypothetical protein